MFNTFNMGVGMVIVADKAYAQSVARNLKANGVDAYVMGELVPGDGEVLL